MNMIHATILTAAMMLIIIGMFMLLRTHNIIRVIIAVEVMMKAISLLLVFAGAINGNFAMAQTFVVTMIVIEVVVAVVAAGVAISIFRHNNDLDIRKLNKLNG